MATVGFIGLGKMGLAMARRLLEAGHRLQVHNRTAAKAELLVGQGARLATTAREACSGASAVIAMTADDASSRAAWLGADGILAADMAAGSLAIECTTLSHGWVLELAGAAATRRLRFIDAPVTGLPEDAARGKLTLLVGAADEDLTTARPLLAGFSERIFRFGPPGAGTAYKLITNLMGAVHRSPRRRRAWRSPSEPGWTLQRLRTRSRRVRHRVLR